MARFSVGDRTNLGSQRLPAGEYHIRVKEANIDSGDKGDYVWVTVEVIDGEFKGRTQRLFFPLSDKAEFKINRFLNALGYDCESSEYDTDEFIGRTLIMTGVRNRKTGDVDFLEFAPDTESESEEESAEEEPTEDEFEVEEPPKKDSKPKAGTRKPVVKFKKKRVDEEE